MTGPALGILDTAPKDAILVSPAILGLGSSGQLSYGSILLSLWVKNLERQ